MPYFIAEGTIVLKFFSSLREMIEFHKKMPAMERHFSKLYDRPGKRYAWGCLVQWDYDDPDNWYEWR